MGRIRAGLVCVWVSAMVASGCGSDDSPKGASRPMDASMEPDAGPTPDAGGGEDARMPDTRDATVGEDADMPIEPSDGGMPDADVDGGGEPPRRYPGPCTTEYFGEDPQFVLERETFSYDGQGRVVGEASDSLTAPEDGPVSPGADGVDDRSLTKEFAEDGSLLSLAEDWDADGVVDLMMLFDDDGNQVSDVWDVRDDGTTIVRTEWTYNDSGQVEELQRDTDGDGSANERTTYSYDAQGHLVRMDVDRTVGDGVIDSSEVYVYASGLLEREELLDSAGQVERVRSWTYDGDGNATQKSYDDDADGTPERIDRWTYDAEGRMQTEAVDEDADGTAEEARTFDDAGRVLTDESYEDGVLDVRESFDYDAEGHLLTHRVTDQNDALLSSVSYGYGEAGRLESVATDSDGDGQDESLTRYAYREDGRPLSIRTRAPWTNGEFVDEEVYIYDMPGNLTEVRTDADLNGSPDETTMFDYSCW